jgi:hypothetical protein
MYQNILKETDNDDIGRNYKEDIENSWDWNL